MHRCWQHFVPTLSECNLCFHSFAEALHQAGNLELEDCWSHWCVTHTPSLPDLLFKPVLSSQRENKIDIQRLKKVLKNFHIYRVVAAAGSFKGRLWVSHPGCDTNPAQPGRRGIMKPPLCFWADKLRRAVGVLAKHLGSLYRQHCWDWWWLGCQDLEVPFGTAFSSLCCSQPCGPCGHHGQAPSRAARIAHHIFCQGHSWQGMVVRETPIPPPIELISYCHSVTLPLEK